jgi:hypothetical protein
VQPAVKRIYLVVMDYWSADELAIAALLLYSIIQWEK